ncbi:Uncharacterized protein dnm_017870 [Desulfonema magnum]|uniref:Uncharacterized protein n=1 Tax=Desulfonema magnum TaxID=45655 RepID=A0A975BI22_9BACT|nr:Uncharacterized protein dnm_017870 [Desulfonema magnum]
MPPLWGLASLPQIRYNQRIFCAGKKPGFFSGKKPGFFASLFFVLYTDKAYPDFYRYGKLGRFTIAS